MNTTAALYIIIQDTDNSSNWTPRKKYNLQEAIERAKEFARSYPSRKFYVCRITHEVFLSDIVVRPV